MRMIEFNTPYWQSVERNIKGEFAKTDEESKYKTAANPLGKQSGN